MRRIIVAVVVLLLVAAAASYTGYWFYIAGRLPEAIAGWAEARRGEGYGVRLDSLAVGGFPTSFRVTLAGAVKGAVPPGQLRQALATWRDDGGTIELEEGALRWGSLAASANGTLALDAALQPIGALTATIENHNAVIDAAVAGGTLRADDANLAKVLLGLMAKPGADGKKRLTLPVTLQNRRLYLGPAQIAVLPAITWE